MSEPKPMLDNFVSAFGDRFRQQYPQGSIISDLVQIHGDQYVVKVSVSLANNILVSTLAADANITLAENRAMERALTILGIRDIQQPAPEPVNLTVQPLPDLPVSLTNALEQPAVINGLSSDSFNGATSSAVVSPIETIESPIIIEDTAPPAVPVVPAPEPIRMPIGATSEISAQPMQFAAEPSSLENSTEITMSTTESQVAPDAIPSEILATLPQSTIPTASEPLVLAASEPEVLAVSEPEVLATKSSRTKKATTTPDPLPDAPLDAATLPIAEPPLSVTDMIPMINMELKRLGWSKERGREYMVSLYNKRASALLSDEELFGLLQHLQAEPVV